MLATPEKTSPELLAPHGWQKKVASGKKGGTPTSRDVFFIAPDGEELKSKRMLEQYLKSHPGGPTLSEFDWSTGETPRRSSRLSSKSRPSIDSPEGGSGGKRPKKNVCEEEAPQFEEIAKPEEEAPQNEEVAKPEEPSTEVLPNSTEEDKVMKDVETVEAIKPSEDTVMASIEEKIDDKVAEIVEVQIDETEKATPETIQEGTRQDEEKKSIMEEAPIEEKSGGEQFDAIIIDTKVREDKDDGKNQLGEVSFAEEHKEQNAFSDKGSSGFQQFPEAQNSSRPVGVTI